jgi:hypothetical protein
MTPRERLLEALYGEEPDTVPLFEIEINRPVVKEILGRDPNGAMDFYEVYSNFGLDGINFWDVPVPVKNLDAKSFIDEWARIWKTGENDITFYINGAVNSTEDFEKFSPPDPFDYSRLDRLRKVISNNKNQLAVVGGIHDGYEIPSQMRGVSNFLIDLYRNPSFVKKLIEASVSFNVELAKAMIDIGVDAIISGDDYAYKQGPMMAPKHFRELIAPGLKKIVDAVHKKGKPFIKHTGLVAPLDRVNVDTDQMVPKQFLKWLTREGFGRVLFYDWCYDRIEAEDRAVIRAALAEKAVAGLKKAIPAYGTAFDGSATVLILGLVSAMSIYIFVRMLAGARREIAAKKAQVSVAG